MNRNHGVPAIALAVLAVVATGCSSDTAGSPEAAFGAPSSAPPGPPSEPSSSAPPTTSSTTKPPPKASPDNAANGTNLNACGDGRCEVFVSGTRAIPLGKKFGFTQFIVTHTPGQLTVYGEDPVNGNLNASVGGSGQITAGPNGLRMDIVSTGKNGAILRFRPE